MAETQTSPDYTTRKRELAESQVYNTVFSYIFMGLGLAAASVLGIVAFHWMGRPDLIERIIPLASSNGPGSMFLGAEGHRIYSALASGLTTLGAGIGWHHTASKKIDLQIKTEELNTDMQADKISHAIEKSKQAERNAEPEILQAAQTRWQEYELGRRTMARIMGPDL
jgi:hypothetical protein